MSKPTLHMIGLFHTVPAIKYSHCAFTGKVLHFSKMMIPFGYEVIEYANGDSESMATEKVKILDEDRLDYLKRVWLKAKQDLKDCTKKGDDLYWAYVERAKSLVGTPVDTEAQFHGDTAAISSPHWSEFDAKLRVELGKRVKKGDIICHPFGRSHQQLVQDFPQCIHVETGIGYPDRPIGAYRIFETYTWMAYHQGRDCRSGTDYEWVVPNYFDLDEWPVTANSRRTFNDGYLLYFGRICPEKGMSIIQALAAELNEKIVVVGQGSLGEFAHPNLEQRPAVKGRERIDLLANARALLMPTRFVEPFGGAGVEGQLMGTPLISSDFGAFSETVEHRRTGFRCHTLADYVAACDGVRTMDREYIRERARVKYCLEACGFRYDNIFMTLNDLWNKGWYSKTPHLL